MSAKNGRHASAISSVGTDPSAPKNAGDAGAARLTLAHTLLLIAFPALGAVLFALGMTTSEIPVFLGYCGGIGAAVTIAVTGGRRALLAIAHGIIAATGAGK